MSDGARTDARRYVVVEFRGGPRDGDREVWPYPLPTREIVFPGSHLVSAAAWPTAAAAKVDFVTHSYRTSDTDYRFDIIAVTPLLASQIGSKGVEDLVRTKGRRPIIFTHHG